MCSNYSKLSSKSVENNLTQGCYRPQFFELQNYSINKLEFNNYSYRSEEIEKNLLVENYSFAYLREDKLRTIIAYDLAEQKIPFADFLNHFSLKINSSNIFKTGKYLSRVFRPVKHGAFFKDLRVHINTNPATMTKNTDGISLISLKLAKSVGWKEATVNSSAQFTLLNADGMVKGNCVVTDKIRYDLIVYGQDNIKKDISLTNGSCYISLERLKLSESLRIDIQSLLNLWTLFGGEQYLGWAYKGMQRFKQDLMSGDLIKWLDDRDDEPDSEAWTLKKAIYNGIDYRRFPGLLRQAWGMYRKSLIRYAYEKNGELNIRIPVPGGLRGYIRVDLRNHDADGNFIPTTEKGIVSLDELGNLWIHEGDIAEFMQVKGGADQDDSVAIIPVEGNKAVIYRNPNQYGEYGVHTIKYEGVIVAAVNKITGEIPYKTLTNTSIVTSNRTTGNNMLDKFLLALPVKQKASVTYNITALLKTYNHLKESNSSIGLAANAEMILSAIRMSNQTLADELNRIYHWDLERIIDSQVKDGVSADEDMSAVQNLLGHIYYNRISIPQNLLSRFPEKMRDDLQAADSHPFDELIHAIKYLIDKTDVEILGRGSAKKGNRIPGLIDKADVPVKEIGVSNLGNRINDAAGQLLTNFNRSIAIMLERTKLQPEPEKEITRFQSLEKIQIEFLCRLHEFKPEERQLLVKSFAYKIYSSERAPHDSILWIGDKDGLKGTADDTIQMLNKVLNVPLPQKVHSPTCPTTQNYNYNNLSIRLWSEAEVYAESFKSINEIMISQSQAILGKVKLNIGSEYRIKDGVYKVSTINQSYSRKNKNLMLKNSVTISLKKI